MTTLKEKKSKNDNLPLTVNETLCQRAQNFIKTLELAPMDYKENETYTPENSGDYFVHWDSLEKLIYSNMQCAQCVSNI